MSILRTGLEKEKKKVSSKVWRKFRRGNFIVSFFSFILLFLFWAFGVLNQVIHDGEHYFFVCIGFIFTFWLFSFPAKRREVEGLKELEISFGLDGKIDKNTSSFGPMTVNIIYSLIGAFLALIITLGLTFFTQVIPTQARYDYINVYSNVHDNLDVPVMAPSKQEFLSKPLSLYQITDYQVLDEFDHTSNEPLIKLNAGEAINFIGNPLGDYRLVLFENEIVLAPIHDIALIE